jgi:hypothetical protein
MGWPPASNYWTYRLYTGVYGLSKPSSHRQQMLGFAPTASMIGSGEKLGTDSWISQPACCGFYQGPFCSGAVALLNSVDDFAKDCYMWNTWDMYGQGPYTDQLLYVNHVRYVWSRDIHRPSVKSVWRVGRVFPCRVYIDLNCHDSQI